METLSHEAAAALMSRRVPWRAALLGLATTGLGQLYCGRLIRAITLFAVALASPFIVFWGLFLQFKPWNAIVPLTGLFLIWLLILVDAIRCARSAPPDYSLKAYNRWYIYLLVIVLAAVGQEALKSLIRERYVQSFKISTGSTEPTLLIGDHLLVDNRAYSGRAPQRGDTVAFRKSSGDASVFLKRVIAVGGDPIRIQNKKVFVNGTALAETYVQFSTVTSSLLLRDNFPPAADEIGYIPEAWGLDADWAKEMPQYIQSDGLHIPQGCYFVLGDNRDNSLDSRFFGFVRRDDILGKAKVIYFSWDDKSHSARWERIGQIIQ